MGLVAAVLVGELLELTGGAARAGEALSLVVGENELEVGLSRGENLGSVGENLHALVDRVDAGGHESARADDLDETDTAGADLVDVLEVAERRNFDSGVLSGFEHG